MRVYVYPCVCSYVIESLDLLVNRISPQTAGTTVGQIISVRADQTDH